MILDFLFLPLVFFLGIITSYDDYRSGKVRNKWIAIGFGWGAAVFLFLFFCHWFSPLIMSLNSASGLAMLVSQISMSYLARSVLNAFLALAVGFLMWRGGAWAAGDAKLFAVYALLMPLKYYWKSYLPYFPSFALLLNMFVPIFIYLLIMSLGYDLKFAFRYLLKAENRDEMKAVVGMFSLKKLSKSDKFRNTFVMTLFFLLVFIIFSLFSRAVTDYISLDMNSAWVVLLSFFIVFNKVLAKIFRKKIVFGLIIISFIATLIYGFAVYRLNILPILANSLKTMALFMIAFGLISGIINFYLKRTGTREIDIDGLRPKMNLTKEVIDRLKQDRQYYDEKIGAIYACGLNIDQVAAVKKWFSGKGGAKTALIYKPLPFVWWMFVGVIITIAVNGSLFHILMSLAVD